MATSQEDLEDRLAAVAVAAAPPLTIDQIDELREILAPAIRALRAKTHVVALPAVEQSTPARAA
jgi:hypothetical protein